MMQKTSFDTVLEHFKKRDLKIYDALRTVDIESWFTPWIEFRGDDYFTALCRAIIGQQLSVKAANTIYKRFTDLYKTTPSPKNVLETKDETLRNAGLSWSKVKYIKDLADKVASSELDLHILDTLADSQVIDELTKVKGIGRWTAEMFLMFNLHRENIFSFGDLGLKRGIERIYGLKDPTTIKIESIVKKWHPYKTYGSIALWHSII